MPDSAPIDDPLMERFVRAAGAKLEAAALESGDALPPELTGETFVRWALNDMKKEMMSPGGRDRAERWSDHVKRIFEDLSAELPGGRENPSFRGEFATRVKRWAATLGPADL